MWLQVCKSASTYMCMYTMYLPTYQGQENQNPAKITATPGPQNCFQLSITPLGNTGIHKFNITSVHHTSSYIELGHSSRHHLPSSNKFPSGYLPGSLHSPRSQLYYLSGRREKVVVRRNCHLGRRCQPNNAHPTLHYSTLRRL